jgi:hypothetical protein
MTYRPLLLAVLLAALALPAALPAAASADAEVEWESPDLGSTLSGSDVDLRVDVDGSSDVEHVRFYVDGRRLATEYEWPYTAELDTTDLRDGRHRLTAVATLDDGRVVSSRTIRVSNGASRKRSGRRAGRVTAGRGCGSDPIFESGFETGGFGDWLNVQALRPRVALVRGGAFCGARAARFELRRGDVEPETGSNRSEVTGPRFREGDELWFRQATRVRRGFPQEGKFQIVSQWKSGDGSPPLALFVRDGLQLAIKRGDSPYTQFWSAPIEAGAWYDLVTHVKFSRSSSVGYVEVWLNGRRQAMENGRERMYGQTIKDSWGYVKLGYYRDRSHRGTGVVYHDNYLIGRSMADVAPRR